MSALPLASKITLGCWMACLFFANPSSDAFAIFILADDNYDDDDVSAKILDVDYDDLNVTAEQEKYLGSPCDDTCNPLLQNVYCNKASGLCECKKLFPVRLGPTKGCAESKKLGEQCFYQLTCIFEDEHSTCTQIQHNAICDCEEGYHRVALSRPNKKTFCAKDLVMITTDFGTFLVIISAIAIFTGLICFVLKLFNEVRPQDFANANYTAPIIFSSDSGIPMTLYAVRPQHRERHRNSSGNFNYAFARKPSTSGTRGPGTSSSKAGSRRPSMVSLHSSTSSAKSYSAQRLERERTEKEHRLMTRELKLAKKREQQASSSGLRTPHSADGLSPSVEENNDVFLKDQSQTDPEMAKSPTKTSIAVTSEVVTVVTTPLFDKEIVPCTSTDCHKS